MNLRQLAYWLAVVEEGSFTRAAHGLHISQPSLSQQIRALESELGGPLLERLPRSVSLTPAGRALLPEAEKAVIAAERAAQAARSALRIETGELEIATVNSVAVGILPASVRRWHQRFPRVMIRLHEYSHREKLEERLAAGFGDIAVGPRPREWGGGLRVLGWEEFVLVLPATDELAPGTTSLPLDALANRRWVLFERRHGLSALVDSFCARSGFTPRPAVETSQVEAACRLAAAGLGPALVPENILPPGLDAKIIHPDPPLGRELAVFTRGHWSSSAEAYVDILREGTWNTCPPGGYTAE